MIFEPIKQLDIRKPSVDQLDFGLVLPVRFSFHKVLFLLFSNRADSVDEVSERQLRLHTVRSLFLQLYFKAVGCTPKFEAGSSLSSIFDQVTEKIREGWGTVV